MGTVNFSLQSFYDSTSELVGFKSGILLSDLTMNKILLEKYNNEDFLIQNDVRKHVRIKSGDIQEMIKYLRIRIGNLPPSDLSIDYGLIRPYLMSEDGMINYSKLSNYARSLRDVGQLTKAALYKRIKQKNEHLTDDVINAFVITILAELDDEIYYPPNSRRQMDQVMLDKLFDEEIKPSSDGAFLDQKFLDYLAVNGHEIEGIHWRNFERFIAEYFKRKNYHIVLGPGTNDGGVDIRAFNPDNLKDPLILIQCKRHSTNNQVDINTVKAFHADLAYEDVPHGLIATTGYIASGGKKVVEARNYNISFAENEKVKQWSTAMWQFS